MNYEGDEAKKSEIKNKSNLENAINVVASQTEPKLNIIEKILKSIKNVLRPQISKTKTKPNNSVEDKADDKSEVIIINWEERNLYDKEITIYKSQDEPFLISKTKSNNFIENNDDNSGINIKGEEIKKLLDSILNENQNEQYPISNTKIAKGGQGDIPDCFKMSRQWSKICATLWKCFKVRKRHYLQTLFTILIPLILFFLVAYARSKVTSLGKHQINETTYNPIYQDVVLYNKYKIDVGNTKLYFAPENGFTEELVREVQMKLDMPNHAIKGFDTEDDLLLFYNNNPPEATYAIIFKDLIGNETPKKLNYDIRSYDKFLDWKTDELYFSNIISNYIPGIGSETYFNKGFIVLQLALNEVFLKMQLQQNVVNVSFAMQEFPYPPHTEDTGLSDLFMHLLPFVTLFSFLLICPSTLKRIVEEKDSGIKELMKMMGLPPSTMWFCWFIDAILLNLISIIIIVLFLKVGLFNGNVVIEHSDCFILFLFFLLYCSSCIAICFVISTLMDSPNLTTIFGIIFWMVSYLIPYSFSETMNMFGFYEKGLICMLPNVAMYYGFKGISVYESRGIGVTWSNLFTSASGGENDLSLGHTFIFFIISITFFLFLTFYLDSVRPGKYGLPKSWTFPLSNLRSCFTKYTKKRRGSITDGSCTINIDTYTKVEECHLDSGIEIERLRKNYGSHTAVNDLNIKFYKGEITVLLGHNGAGKTTTMSILTGMIKATKGRVTIANYDINESLDYIRSLIGVCPQHNLLFPDLTVKEHLQFFAKLNDIDDYNTKIRNLLRKLKLTDQKNSLPSKLSGGMKRKLCLGMAIISDPVVLILDEPTSGLDPKSRREIWDILLEWRKEQVSSKRTVLISTHFMEEAEVLGNRIAIMDHGNLIAYGTPMYLKKEYSTGYILSIFKKEQRGIESQDVQNSKIDKMITDEIDEASSKIKVGNTLTYLLPHESKSKFTKLLKAIEAGKEELGIDNYNVSITTLEDIFLKISNLVNNETDDKCTGDDKDNLVHGSEHTTIGSRKKHCTILLRNHFQIIKGLAKSYSLYVLVSMMIILITLLLATPTTFSFLRKKQEFTMNLGNYGPSTVFYSGSNDVPFVKNIMQNFENIIRDQSGSPKHVPSVSEGLVNLGLKNIEEYRQHAIIATEFNYTSFDNKVILNMMYSNVALHGAPIAVNLAFNTILKAIFGNDVGIIASNVPLPATKAFNSKQQSEVQVALLWMLLFPMAMLFLVSSFIIYPYKERSSNMKNLVYMTGVKSICYWFWMFVFDIFIYVVCYIGLILMLIGIFSSITDTFFRGPSEYGAMFVLLLAYGISSIPYSYLFSYKKTIPSAFATFVMINLFTGVVLTVVVLVLQNSGEEYYENWGEWLHYPFQILPQYWFTFNIVTFSRKAVFNYNWDVMDPLKKASVCRFNENPCCPINGVINTTSCANFQSYFTDSFTELNTAGFTVITFIIYGLLLLLADSFFIVKLLDFNLKSYVRNNKDHKRGEILQRTNSDNSNDSMKHSSETDELDSFYKVKHLKKQFGSQTVVDNLDFNVVAKKCFGLLGVNGAGKTTTFRMLTGDSYPSSGTATINSDKNYDLNDNRDDYLKYIGYCPQFNAINEILNPRQLLTLFAELRGVDNVHKEVDQWIDRLGLTEYGNKPSGNLSGGNKRKLSLGISLIGNCSVIMLDEPTSGVDPAARRKLWNVLKQVKNSGRKSIILTSHSMDECEMLCDSLAIMKAGQIKCQGKIHNLKDEYGKGYTVLIRLKKSVDVDEVDGSYSTQNDSADIKKDFQEIFENLDLKPDLKDEHESLLHYYVPYKLTMCEMFEEMEKFKNDKNHHVEDYFINKATLEDVFLSFSSD